MFPRKSASRCPSRPPGRSASRFPDRLVLKLLARLAPISPDSSAQMCQDRSVLFLLTYLWFLQKICFLLIQLAYSNYRTIPITGLPADPKTGMYTSELNHPPVFLHSETSSPWLRSTTCFFLVSTKQLYCLEFKLDLIRLLQVPEEKCVSVPKEECKQVPKEECKQVPKQACTPVYVCQVCQPPTYAAGRR